MNPDRSNNLSLKYQRFTPLGCKDIGIRKFKFVSKTQFLCFYFKKKERFVYPVRPLLLKKENVATHFEQKFLS